ncbi:MAG: hypothetical protein JNJ71_11525 [Rubrivivax sp.]|nr:hypothetical protein [Rubrivivax sp.]
MSRTPSTALARSVVGTAPSGESREHRRFQQLLQRIDDARARLALWQEQLPLFAQSHQERVEPVRQRLLARRREWVFELEQLMLGRKWGKAERQTLEMLIVDQALDLIEETADEDAAELKALYQRITGTAFEALAQQQVDALKAALEEVSGLDLGDEPAESIEQLMQRAHAHMHAQMHDPAASAGPDHGRSRRKGRGSAAQKKAQLEADRISQTVKEVYRKLAGALHPDRAPADASPAQRALMGERMARANAAYAAGDLLSLLSLQLEIEQVDLSRPAQLPLEQVRHFNRVLAEQLRELDLEIQERELTFQRSFGYGGSRRIDPSKLGKWLTEDLRQLLAAEASLTHDQRVLRNDPTGARWLLKEIAAERRFEDEMAELTARSAFRRRP